MTYIEYLRRGGKQKEIVSDRFKPEVWEFLQFIDRKVLEIDGSDGCDLSLSPQEYSGFSDVEMILKTLSKNGVLSYSFYEKRVDNYPFEIGEVSLGKYLQIQIYKANDFDKFIHYYKDLSEKWHVTRVKNRGEKYGTYLEYEISFSVESGDILCAHNSIIIGQYTISDRQSRKLFNSLWGPHNKKLVVKSAISSVWPQSKQKRSVLAESLGNIDEDIINQMIDSLNRALNKNKVPIMIARTKTTPCWLFLKLRKTASK